jgi:lipase
MARRLSDRFPDRAGHGGARGGTRRATGPRFPRPGTEHALGLLPEGPVHLIGHSFGATVALRLAIEAPERVASLTLIEPVLFAAAPDGPEKRANAERWDGWGR